MSEPFSWPEEIVAKRSRLQSDLVVPVGKLVADEVHLLSRKLVSGGHVPAERTLRAGGAPANISAQLVEHGLPARLTGWVGADPIAQGLVAELTARGVEIRCKVEGRSPKATVLVDDTGERALLTDDGDGTLRAADVDAAWFEGAAVVHLDGYDLLSERFPDAVQRAAQLAHEQGLIVSVDMAASNRIEEFGVDAYLAQISQLAPDIMFSNADEAKVLRLNAQSLPWLPLLVTHRGAQSTFVSTRSQKRQYEVPKRPIVDSTGCGDALAAGFLAGFLEGLPIDEAVTKAHDWAGSVADVLGSQLPVGINTVIDIRDQVSSPS